MAKAPTPPAAPAGTAPTPDVAPTNPDAPVAPAAPSQDIQNAAASLGTSVEEVVAKQSATKAYPARARVRSKVGEMRHLGTNQLVTSDEKMMDIDGFAIAQLNAGKWEIVAD